MSLNQKLLPFERAAVLRAFGYNIKGSSGEIYNIRNKAYRDRKPSLCINLDNGLCNDFGDANFSGDIIKLLINQMGLSFKDIAIRIEEIIGRNLSEAPVFEDTSRNVKKEPFYNEFTMRHTKKMNEKLREASDSVVDYTFWYDGIVSKNTLLRYGCGLYSYQDYDLGRSGKSFLINTFLSIPYRTGVMLYRRSSEKIVRHIKGSSATESFFGHSKKMKKDNLLIIAKSPREAMSLAEYLNFNYNVFGMNSNEHIKEISQIQQDQIESVKHEDYALNIKLLIDCDDESSFIKAMETATVIKNKRKDIIVHLCSIHHASDGESKDFSDLFQNSLPPDVSDKIQISSNKKLNQKNFDIFKKAIQEPIKII